MTPVYRGREGFTDRRRESSATQGGRLTPTQARALRISSFFFFGGIARYLQRRRMSVRKGTPRPRGRLLRTAKVFCNPTDRRQLDQQRPVVVNTHGANLQTATKVFAARRHLKFAEGQRGWGRRGGVFHSMPRDKQIYRPMPTSSNGARSASKTIWARYTKSGSGTTHHTPSACGTPSYSTLVGRDDPPP